MKNENALEPDDGRQYDSSKIKVGSDVVTESGHVGNISVTVEHMASIDIYNKDNKLLNGWCRRSECRIASEKRSPKRQETS